VARIADNVFDYQTTCSVLTRHGEKPEPVHIRPCIADAINDAADIIARCKGCIKIISATVPNYPVAISSRGPGRLLQ